MTADEWARRAFKPAVFTLCLLPLAALLADAWTGHLGSNPVETMTHRTGLWALRLLLITLTVTPLRRLTGWSGIMRARRMLGLYAFFYALLHFTTYLVFEQYFDFMEILKDIRKHPHITFGFAAFLTLILLAATSTDRMMRRLGKHWRQLHQAVYVAVILAVMHYLWLVKVDLRDPLAYAALMLLLFSYRVVYQRLKERPRTALPVDAPGPD